MVIKVNCNGVPPPAKSLHIKISLPHKSLLFLILHQKIHENMFAVTVESLRSALLESDSASKTERSKSYDEGLESYQEESRGSVHSIIHFYYVLNCGPSDLDVLLLYLSGEPPVGTCPVSRV